MPPGQPFATIVTKDYPDDTASRLDEPGRWRLNVHVGRARLAELVGDEPRDPAAVDTFVRHPVHGDQGWVSVVVPGDGAGVRWTPAHDQGTRAVHSGVPNFVATSSSARARSSGVTAPSTAS